MTPVAAIDCGTNSIRLLIADRGPDGDLVELDRRLEIVRLGQGIDATGEFHPAALERTFAAVDQYAEAVRAAGVPRDKIHFVATSAARDAGNREAFFAGIRDRLGTEPDVITGEREAHLSFIGALSGAGDVAEPVLVMDIGGGSTELIIGSAAGEIDFARSLDIGSVRLTERFWPDGQPGPEQLGAAAGYVDELLDASGADFGHVRTWIGVAGTATTLAGVYLELDEYDRSRVHRSTIPLPAIGDLLAMLASSTVEEIRAIASMHPKRADVITAGALIVGRIARRISTDALLVSESDILDGIALELLNS
ncbi:MAG: Ppx/GppA phosphatase [Propionibacteriaceae bacterium]|jgi:exopolyphosphatase/guanosine-5'-triphosphate,3'-diphosphate pyrophosphatase|nr:Ppx/GppA phosphatase [Propionibacteriaceae bacterium]